jgi:serine acetyltransferase
MQESVIGTGVSILQGASQEEKLQIGPKSTVGIGSVVMRSVPKERTVFGSPAEVLSSE